MPVQDNDDKRTADQPAVDAEEELRRKQAQAQEQQQEESGAQKSGKLLPFLNAKAEHHQSRIDSIDEKIANQTVRLLKKAIFELPNSSISFQDWTSQITAAMDI